MKTKTTLFLVLLGVLATTAMADIPDNRYYDIRIACYQLAIEVRNESAAVADHCDRLKLANKVMRISPVMTLPLKLAEAADAAGGPIDWETITVENIKAKIGAVWTDVAVLMHFGEPDCDAFDD